MSAPKNGGLKLLFDRRLRLEFRGAKITTDAGLLAVRELDEMMGLTDMAADLIVDKRTGKNIQHQVSGLLRQSVYARLAGYEDTNDPYKSQCQDNISPYTTSRWFFFVCLALEDAPFASRPLVA